MSSDDDKDTNDDNDKRPKPILQPLHVHWLRLRHRWLNWLPPSWLTLLLPPPFRPQPAPMRLTDKTRGQRRDPGFIQRHIGTLFVVCVFVAFMQGGLLTGHTTHESTEVYPDVASSWHPRPDPGAASDGARRSSAAVPQPLDVHPIPRLMAHAEDSFRALLSKQSRSLRAAVREYRRRYGRDPPKGFDDWWKFAKRNGVKLVDEFDGLVEDFAPFWGLSGEELRRRAMQVCVCASFMLLGIYVNSWKVGFLPSIDMVRLKDGKVSVENIKTEFTEDPGARAKGFQDLLHNFASKVRTLKLPTIKT